MHCMHPTVDTATEIIGCCVFPHSVNYPPFRANFPHIAFRILLSAFRTPQFRILPFYLHGTVILHWRLASYEEKTRLGVLSTETANRGMLGIWTTGRFMKLWIASSQTSQFTDVVRSISITCSSMLFSCSALHFASLLCAYMSRWCWCFFEHAYMSWLVHYLA